MKPLLCCLLLAVGGSLQAADSPSADDLHARFANPPESAQPFVFWFWMNGNVTKEGITADLEAMHRIGIGGAVMMGVGLGTPPGDAIFNTPLWRELYAHAAKECVRLGMHLVLHQCDGWATAGGPWITPDRSIKMLVWTTDEITGPSSKPIKLPRPKAKEDFYEDVAVIAVPMDLAQPVNPSLATIGGKPAPELIDAKPKTALALPKVPIDLTFDAPQTVGTLVFRLPDIRGVRFNGNASMPTTVEVSADGETFHKVAEFDLNVDLDDPPSDTMTVSFPPEQAMAVRVRIKDPVASTQISEIELFGEQRVNLWEVKASFARRRNHGSESPWLDSEIPRSSPGGIATNTMIDLSKKLGPDGTLDWKVPEGRWQIIRLGMTSTGKRVSPATQGKQGLEADKMSGDAIRFHFDSFAKGMIAENNKSPGNPISAVHTDSWESGIHTWSNHFQEEFEKRRGYSMTPWLPVLATGRIVGSAEESDRFLWDVRRTMADLIRDNYYGEMQRLCHASDVLYQSESAGRQSFMYDPINYFSKVDIPMGEFWTESDEAEEVRFDCKSAASASHIYNRPITAAESFTGRGDFSLSPFDFKALGDHAFATGINRFFIHRYAMQPWIGIEPGMTFGSYGINFERTQTWWDNGGKAWMEYLTRSQALLQTGRFVADVIHYIGDDAPNLLGHREQIWNPVPAGYEFDGCNLEILEKLTVAKNGDLVLPHGPRYRVLLLPDRKHMTLPAIQAVERLVEAGATAVGPKPLRTPGLTNWKENDAKTRAIADRLWGAIGSDKVTENRVGKGRVIFGKQLSEILNAMAPPDFDYTAPEGTRLRYSHRTTGEADLYFVANADRETSTDAVVRFRVTGKAPEFWDPSTGAITKPAVYRQASGVTEVPMHFDPAGSVFVVFREPVNPDALATVTREGSQKPLQLLREGEMFRLLMGEPGTYTARTAADKTVKFTVAPTEKPIAITGPWSLSFPPDKGAPATAEFPKLISWTQSEDPGIKYFSGTATYRTEFDWKPEAGKRKAEIILDLGNVKNIAQVRVNGKDLGTLWKPPFRTDITNAIKPGTNTLEVCVTNTWKNRLVGDEKLHPDPGLKYAEGKTANRIVPVLSIPDWVKAGGKSPAGRSTFVLTRYYRENEPLLDSGLLGPVTLQTAAEIAVKP